MTMRPVVYIAGKMSDPDVIQVLRNFQRFTECENAMLRNGFAPINPGADVDAVALGGVGYEDCLQKDLAVILRCDAVYFLRGWEHSPGAKREREWAQTYGVPCVDEPIQGYTTFNEIRQAIYEKNVDLWIEASEGEVFDF